MCGFILSPNGVLTWKPQPGSLQVVWQVQLMIEPQASTAGSGPSMITGIDLPGRDFRTRNNPELF